jgi:hypothetical protein
MYYRLNKNYTHHGGNTVKLNEIKDVQMIMKYLPNLDVMYRDPNAPDAFKAFFRTLKGKVDQIMKDQQ